VKPDPEKPRVLRGGGWNNDDLLWLRGAHRVGGAPSWQVALVGFRPVLDLDTPTTARCESTR